MDRYLEMQTFCAVVDAGSFIKAAEEMNASKATVSRYVSDLETRLGVRLLHRTTRRLSLTEEGELFYARCRILLAELEDAESEVSFRSTNVSGRIRVNAPVSYGIRYLAPLWDRFHTMYPLVTLDVMLSDQIVDLVDESYDLAIRIARLTDSSLVSKLLSTTRIILCASPEYLKHRGLPMQPVDLINHDTIAYSNSIVGQEWRFTGPEGPVSVKLKSWMQSNNGETCVAMALKNKGIVLQPSFLVDAAIARGELVEVLPEYKSMELGIHAVYPSRKHVPPKTRALVDFLSENMKNFSA